MPRSHREPCFTVYHIYIYPSLLPIFFQLLVNNPQTAVKESIEGCQQPHITLFHCIFYISKPSSYLVSGCSEQSPNSSEGVHWRMPAATESFVLLYILYIQAFFISCSWLWWTIPKISVKESSGYEGCKERCQEPHITLFHCMLCIYPSLLHILFQLLVNNPPPIQWRSPVIYDYMRDAKRDVRSHRALFYCILLYISKGGPVWPSGKALGW